MSTLVLVSLLSLERQSISSLSGVSYARTLQMQKTKGSCEFLVVVFDYTLHNTRPNSKRNDFGIAGIVWESG